MDAVAAELVAARPEFDPASFEVAHPRPFWCRIVVDDRLLSRIVPHVSNIEFVRWLDRAAELHADAVGDTRASSVAQNHMWFVARHEIDYLAEASSGDVLWIGTWVRDFGRVKSWRDSVIVRPADGTLICRASTLWVWVDLATRRPRRIPPVMRSRYDPLESCRPDSRSGNR